jgi:hypothetical protein
MTRQGAVEELQEKRGKSSRRGCLRNRKGRAEEEKLGQRSTVDREPSDEGTMAVNTRAAKT